MSGATVITGIVLAAGRSRRMGRRHKLLLDVQGRPLIAATLAPLLASRLTRLIVVTGYQGHRVRAAAAASGSSVRFVHNAHYRHGLSASLRHGCAAVDRRSDGVLICLADMPFVTAATVDALIAAFDPPRGSEVCVPTFAGVRGNPVLWSRRFLPQLMHVSGDAGARTLLQAQAPGRVDVPVADAGVLRDVDTPVDLLRRPPLRRRSRPALRSAAA